MKLNYETSRVTISKKPLHTYHIRIQNFLIHPAKGRSTEQLTRDFQELMNSTKANPNFSTQLQLSYALGLARSHPNKAVKWARSNITGFDSKPTIKNQFFNTWQKMNPTTANRWVKEHPEFQVTMAKPVDPNILKWLNQPAINCHHKTTITLPR